MTRITIDLASVEESRCLARQPGPHSRLDHLASDLSKAVGLIAEQWGEDDEAHEMLSLFVEALRAAEILTEPGWYRVEVPRQPMAAAVVFFDGEHWRASVGGDRIDSPADGCIVTRMVDA